MKYDKKLNMKTKNKKQKPKNSAWPADQVNQTTPQQYKTCNQ